MQVWWSGIRQVLSYNVEFGLDVVWKSRVGWKFDIIEILDIGDLVLGLIVKKLDTLPVIGPPVRTKVDTYLVGLVHGTEEIKIVTLEEGKLAARFSNCTELARVRKRFLL